MSNYTKDDLLKITSEYAQTHDRMWLNDFDWQSVPVDKFYKTKF